MNNDDIEKRLEAWKNEKKIITIDTQLEVDESQNRVDIHDELFDDSLRYSKNKITNKDIKEHIYLGVVLLLFLIIIIYAFIFLPLLYNNVSYDIECEKLIQTGDENIQRGEYEEGIGEYSHIQIESRYYQLAQEKEKKARELYEKEIVDEAKVLLNERKYEDSYKTVERGIEFLGETTSLKNEIDVIVRKTKESVLPRITVEYTGEDLEEGRNVDISSIKLLVKYTDSISEVVSPYDCSPGTIQQSGDNILTLSWNKGETYEWEINALPKVIQIEASYQGKELIRGEKIKASDCVLIGTCTDGSTRELKNFSIVNDNTETYGKNQIEFVYGELSCNCSIFVLPQELEITATPSKSMIQKGNLINNDSIIVTLHYEDGSERILESKEFEIVSEKSIRYLGENKINVSYGKLDAETIIIGYETTLLLTLDEFSKKGAWSYKTTTEDMLGNEYKKCYLYRAYYDEPTSIEYYLGGKYQGIDGVLSNHCDDLYTSDEYAVINIYADGELKYQSPMISRYTQPFSFEVDLSGAEYMKVECAKINGKNDVRRVILSDAKLKKIK